ncbi:MAG: NERD domain-containing protein [Gammaproteobacteria bacterium]|nr:MAG: NERD domain-containing protein [Gammaproteobacteria bacterium]
MDSSILVPAGAAILPMLIILVMINALRHAEGLRRRKSPFNRDFLRPAGFSLQRRLEELQLELALSFGFGLFVPLWFYSMWLSVQKWNPDAAGLELAMLYMVAGVGGFLFLLSRTLYNYRSLRAIRMGLDGELATGQELDRLMRHGCRIFHDVPAAGSNIDHVVIGPTGVLAVETKAQLRSDRGRGAEDATVLFDGHRLSFPSHSDTGYLDKAGRQAKWLSNWLRARLGEDVPVTPVLSLPGWFVDRRGDGSVSVVNPKEAAKLLQGSSVLDRKRQELIAFQLERACRADPPRQVNRSA